MTDRQCRVTLINTVDDHAHVLFELGRTISLSSAVEDLKKHSSRWLKPRRAELVDFAWQAGYGAFSVSESDVRSVARYIAGQPEHYRTRTFQQEFLDILKEHNVEYDERYLWD